MEEIIKKKINEPVNGRYLLEMVNYKANIEIYPNLIYYDDIDELLGINGACFLLFEVKKNVGHWVLLFKLNNKEIEFFNSYGGYPDDSLDKIPFEYRQQSNQIYPILTELLLNSGYKLHYNEFKFQKSGPNTKTCGRWCILRLLLRKMGIYEFKKIFKNVDGDELVTYLTMILY